MNDEFIKFDGCPYSISTECLESLDCWHPVKDERTGQVTDMRTMSDLEKIFKNYGIDVFSIEFRQKIHKKYTYINNKPTDDNKDNDMYKNGEISKRELIRRRLYNEHMREKK